MHQPQRLPREGDRRAGRPARAQPDGAQARPGEVVTVTRIDRLARSTFDLFGNVNRIVAAKAQFRSLAEPWADTGTVPGRGKGQRMPIRRPRPATVAKPPAARTTSEP